VRVFRDGVYPAVGRDPANLMLSVRRGELTSERLGGDMSAAATSPTTTGSTPPSAARTLRRGYYLQIWRADEKGAWKLALDFQAPLPTGTK
jgi:hypothetical protein